MGASEYLSTKTEGREKCSDKASVYTGLTYVATVALLIMPYLIFEHLFLCLGSTLVLAVVIIAPFNCYVAVAKDLSFKCRFFEMTGLSFALATVSFLISLDLRAFLHVNFCFRVFLKVTGPVIGLYFLWPPGLDKECFRKYPDISALAPVSFHSLCFRAVLP